MAKTLKNCQNLILITSVAIDTNTCYATVFKIINYDYIKRFKIRKLCYRIL